MVTISAGIFNGQYKTTGSVMSESIYGIVEGSDCIGAINWSLYQGFIKTGGYNYKSKDNFKIPLTYALYDKYSKEKIKYTKVKNVTLAESLPVGTVVSTSEHTAMVVGHTIIKGKEYNVVAQTGDKENGYNMNPITRRAFDKKVSVEDILTKWQEKHPENTTIPEENI